MRELNRRRMKEIAPDVPALLISGTLGGEAVADGRCGHGAIVADPGLAHGRETEYRHDETQSYRRMW